MAIADMFDDADILPGIGKTGVLLIPDETGHAKYAWDVDDPQDVDDVRKVFEQKKKEGYSFFLVDPKDDNKQGKQVKDFDPRAGKLFAVPPFAGG